MGGCKQACSPLMMHRSTMVSCWLVFLLVSLLVHERHEKARLAQTMPKGTCKMPSMQALKLC